MALECLELRNQKTKGILKQTQNTMNTFALLQNVSLQILFIKQGRAINHSGNIMLPSCVMSQQLSISHHNNFNVHVF
jgi:hypothetical protein